MIVRVNWGIPLEDKIYKEIGKVMALILPLTEKVIVADSEGVIFQLVESKELIEELREELKEIKLKYVEVSFEEEKEE